MIVVDTNVIAYLFVASEYTEAAENLLARDVVWHAPVLWRSELRSVLAGYLRSQQLSLEQVIQIQSEAEDMMFSREHDADSRRVLELVDESRCSAYDCEFVALAIKLGVKLVTMDKEVIRTFPRHAVALSAA